MAPKPKPSTSQKPKTEDGTSSSNNKLIPKSNHNHPETKPSTTSQNKLSKDEKDLFTKCVNAEQRVRIHPNHLSLSHLSFFFLFYYEGQLLKLSFLLSLDSES